MSLKRLMRNRIFRISVAGNLFALMVYLALYSLTSTSSSISVTNKSNPIIPPGKLPVSNDSVLSTPAYTKKVVVTGSVSAEKFKPPKPLLLEANKHHEGGGENTTHYQDVRLTRSVAQADREVGAIRSANLVLENPKSLIDSEGKTVFDFMYNGNGLSEKRIDSSRDTRLFPCDDYTPRSYYGQRGSYWVLYNYIKQTKSFRCDQSITFTTHAEWTFLDNLVPLLERWQGPISLALYSPGTDFDDTVKRITYLRECGASLLVKKLVTFHLFFDQHHVPKARSFREHELETQPVNCSGLAHEMTFGKALRTYRKAKKLHYPVNVGRNVAREMATTHYVLAADIELYPNPNLIPDFLKMVRLNDNILHRPAPKVFVLPVFEVDANVTALPNDKRELVYMLRNKSAVPFHKFVCGYCHRIPKGREWSKARFKPGLRVFHIAKRYWPYAYWEPVYIGTKFDPAFDERLSWEVRKDKMTQGYLLCVLDYEFHILDNAFLVHRPGIRRRKHIFDKIYKKKRDTLIGYSILPELKKIYGTRPGCRV